jgi:hypothetical protein
MKSHTSSGAAFWGTLVGEVTIGCDGEDGAVGLVQAPNNEAMETRMSDRIVRDIEGSRSGERHRYHCAPRATDIAGDTIIYGGAR